MNHDFASGGRPDLPLSGASLTQRLLTPIVFSLIAGCMAWTFAWYTLHHGDILDALIHPWAAPWAALTWPKGIARDPKLAWASYFAMTVVLLFAGAGLLPRGKKAVYGDARFATYGEIKTMRLLADKGIIIGKLGLLGSTYLRYGGDGHCLLTAPTRSGKGVGVVVPNLLSWQGSIVVLDLKGELFELTSGFRGGSGQKIYRFSPSDVNKQSCFYNPLDTVRRNRERRVGDLQIIAHLLIPDGHGENKMWSQEGRSLFVGMGLYCLDMGEPLTFGQINRMLKTNASVGEVFKQVIEQHSKQLDATTINILANFANKAAKEQSGVKSNLTGALELWDDPLIDNATSRSDFSFDDIRKVGTTIYFCVPQDELERLAFLINIFFQQYIGVMARRMPGKDEPHHVLALIDEFASLGRMDLLVDKMPFMAGYNVHMMLIIQGLAQLDKLYGPAGREIVLQNAAVQIYFASNDDQTSEYVSARLGTFTETQKTTTQSAPSHGLFGGGFNQSTGTVSRSESYYARELMKPEEVQRLPRTHELIFVENARPIKARKIRYYADKSFTQRLLAAINVLPITITFHKPYVFPVGKDAAMPKSQTSPSQTIEQLWPDARDHLSDDEWNELRSYAKLMPSLQMSLPGLVPEATASAEAAPVAEPPHRRAADHATDTAPDDDGEPNFGALLVKEVARAKAKRRPPPLRPTILDVGLNVRTSKAPALGRNMIK